MAVAWTFAEQGSYYVTPTLITVNAQVLTIPVDLDRDYHDFKSAGSFFSKSDVEIDFVFRDESINLGIFNNIMFGLYEIGKRAPAITKNSAQGVTIEDNHIKVTLHTSDGVGYGKYRYDLTSEGDDKMHFKSGYVIVVEGLNTV